LGLGFIFAGLYIVLTGRVITGAVIGAGPENYLGLFGLLFVVVGGFLVFKSRFDKRKDVLRDYNLRERDLF